MTERFVLKLKELRHIVNSIPSSEDDRDVGVFMPYYQRTFPVVAFDELSNMEGQTVVPSSPLVLITSPRPQ